MPRRRIYNDPDPTVVLSNIPSDDAAREFILSIETKLASRSLQQMGG
jgi:hypothetical protein